MYDLLEMVAFVGFVWRVNGMLVIMVSVCNVNCVVGWLSGGILGAFGCMEGNGVGHTSISSCFSPFFCIFSLWVSSFSFNFLVCSSLFNFKFDLPT